LAGVKDAIVPQEGPQDVDAAAGKGDEGLDVFEALSAFLEVEVTVGSLAHHRRLRG